MEYIKLFENHTQYETFINGGGVAKPNVSHCIEENHVHYSKLIDKKRLYLREVVSGTYVATDYLGRTLYYEGNGSDDTAKVIIMKDDTYPKWTMIKDGEEIEIVTALFGISNTGITDIQNLEEYDERYNVWRQFTFSFNGVQYSAGDAMSDYSTRIVKKGNPDTEYIAPILHDSDVIPFDGTYLTVEYSRVLGGEKLCYPHTSITDSFSKIEVLVDGAWVERFTPQQLSDSNGYADISDTDGYVRYHLNDGTKIPVAVFDSCTTIRYVGVPEGVTSIEGAGFYGCTSLTKVSLPSTLTTIKDEAFCDCSKLFLINIPDSVTTISGCSFGECDMLDGRAVQQINNINPDAFYCGVR